MKLRELLDYLQRDKRVDVVWTNNFGKGEIHLKNKTTQETLRVCYDYSISQDELAQYILRETKKHNFLRGMPNPKPVSTTLPLQTTTAADYESVNDYGIF